MANDMIVLFNRLTSSELADYSIFENIIENHYEKFKLFYKIIKKIDLRKIDEIFCVNTNSDTLNISIITRDNKYISDILDSIDKFDTEKYSWCEIETTTNNDSLVVCMSLIDELDEEGDIYDY